MFNHERKISTGKKVAIGIAAGLTTAAAGAVSEEIIRRRYKAQKEEKRVQEVEDSPHFREIAVIGGAGQTGRFYLETLQAIPDGPRVSTVVRDAQKRETVAQKMPEAAHVVSSIQDLFQQDQPPDAFILATPNPADAALQAIADNATAPLTLILPQNGISVAPKAQAIFGGRTDIQLVRASLFTPVGFDNNGDPVYNPDKKRIALAPIKPRQDVFSQEQAISMRRTEKLFRNAGYDVVRCGDYQSMEQIKIFTNATFSSMAVTGLGPKETLEDDTLYELEIKALKNRYQLLHETDVDISDIPWVKKLAWLARTPLPVLKMESMRSYVVDSYASERNNRPSAAARDASKGEQAAHDYNEPFMYPETKCGIATPMDETIYAILTNPDIRLTGMTAEQRKALLLSTYQAITDRAYTPRNPFKTRIADGLVMAFTKEFTVLGAENLDEIRELLHQGKSVILEANHASHADTAAIRKALDKIDPDLARRLIAVAGQNFNDLREKEPLTNQLHDAYAHVNIVSPYDNHQDSEDPAYQKLKTKGQDELKQILERGALVLIYPEGKRSRTGKMDEALSGVALYLRMPNVAAVLPVGITGTEELLPPHKIILTRVDNITVNIGKIRRSGSLLDSVKSEPDEKTQNERMMTTIGTDIAGLIPEDRRGYYKDSCKLQK